jgi:endonuclease/exonuclease/phosphatase (EEP) superfamily protein YafD
VLWHWYTPPELPFDCPAVPNRSFRVLFANVHTKNTRYQDLRRQIEREQPDFVGLVEVNTEWLQDLSLDSEFPYAQSIPQQDNFGIALYSKHPLTVFNEGYGEEVTPAIRAEVTEGDLAGLRIAVVHGIPPLSAAAYRHNRLLLRRIATEVRHARNPYLLMGDFNATIFSGLFRKLFWGGEMRHAGQGGSYFTTWDAESVFKRLMLDHILLSGCLRTTRYERGRYFGSDHYPLVFEGLF